MKSNQSAGISIVTKSLVALLAVVVIAAIVMPLGAGGGPSPNSSCLSNTKQLLLGAMIYANDHQDRLPAAGNWMDDLMPYTKNRDLFRCPVLPKTSYGYAMADRLSRRSIRAIPNPERSILVFESKSTVWNAHGFPLRDLDQSRHQGTTSFGFADGHAKRSSDIASFLMDAPTRGHRSGTTLRGMPRVHFGTSSSSSSAGNAVSSGVAHAR